MRLDDTNQSIRPNVVRADPPSISSSSNSDLSTLQAPPQLTSSAVTPTSSSITPTRRFRLTQTPAPAVLPRQQAPWGIEPDGPGARLPRKPMQRSQKVFLTIGSVLVVAVLIGVLIGHFLLPKPLPRNFVDMGQLLRSSSNSNTNAATLAVHTNWTDAQAMAVANDAMHITSLPLTYSPGATLISNAPSQFAQQLQVSSGLDQAENGVTAPMDVSIASNTQFTLEAVDGALLISDTRGGMGAIGDGRFFAAITHADFAFGEPRVLFDAGSQQWIFVVNEVALVNGNVQASYFDVGISTTASPVASWYVYQIDTYLSTYGDCNWGDAPQIGSDSVGYFISGTNFKCGVDTPLNGVELWELPKTTFAHGRSGPIYIWHNFQNSLGKPMVALVPAVVIGAHSTEWLIGNDAGYVDHGIVSTRLSIWAIAAPSVAQQNRQPAVIGPSSLTLPQAYADPPYAQQPIDSQNQQQLSPIVKTGDARITGAEFINGHLYTAFTTAVNWSGDNATRSGIYWADLLPHLANTQDNGLQADIQQSGIFGAAQTYFFLPAFMADAQGNAVLCADASSATLRMSVVYASHRTSDPLNTLGGPTPQAMMLQRGTTVFTGSYWGDYSGASLVMQDTRHATANLWFAAAIIGTNPASSPGSPDSATTTNWSTKEWELDTTGSALQSVG